MFQVVQKLRFVKAALKAWNLKVFGRVDERIRKAREELYAIQSQLSLDQFNERQRLAEEDILKLDELNPALDTEEAFFKQKARVSWLKDGDHNTQYFHATLTEIRARKTRWRIKDESGTMLTGKVNIKRQAELDFIKIVGTASRVESLFQSAPLLSDAHIKSLIKEVTAKKVEQVVKNMDPDKAPGPDGFNAYFFQSCWDIVKEDLVKAITNLFKEVALEGKYSTFFVLIPQVDNPVKFDDFWTIALCNVIYKILSKILANRLRDAVQVLVSPNQSAFIQGRNILDNVLLAHELVRNFHRQRGIAKFCAKLDIRKAYDSVSWEAVLMCLEAMGFPNLSTGSENCHFYLLLGID